MPEDAGAEIDRCLERLDESRASLVEASPSVFDECMQALAEALMRALPEERTRLTETISMRHRMLVGRGLWRMEQRAVTERSRDLLLRALVVHATLDRGPEYRDTIVWCVIPFLEARLLDVDPVGLFDEAAEFAGPAVAATMRTTGRRTDITAAAFSPVIEETPDGPRPAHLGSDEEFLTQLDRDDFGSRAWLIDEVRRREPDVPERLLEWIDEAPGRDDTPEQR